MAYTDLATLATDPTFVGRVRGAVTKKALAQMAAPFDQSNRFQKRAALARMILTTSDIYLNDGSARTPGVVQQFAWALVANNAAWTVAAQPTDAQLDTALSVAVIDALAGATANE